MIIILCHLKKSLTFLVGGTWKRGKVPCKICDYMGSLSTWKHGNCRRNTNCPAGEVSKLLLWSFSLKSFIIYIFLSSIIESFAHWVLWHGFLLGSSWKAGEKQCSLRVSGMDSKRALLRPLPCSPRWHDFSYWLTKKGEVGVYFSKMVISLFQAMQTPTVRQRGFLLIYIYFLQPDWLNSSLIVRYPDSGYLIIEIYFAPKRYIFIILTLYPILYCTLYYCQYLPPTDICQWCLPHILPPLFAAAICTRCKAFCFILNFSMTCTKMWGNFNFNHISTIY